MKMEDDMKKQFFILVFVLLALGLSCQDTWIRTYSPFDSEYIEDFGEWMDFDVLYEVEDVLVTQDGGYVISGNFERWFQDEFPMWWDRWGFLVKTDNDGNLLWAKKDSLSFMEENLNHATVETEEGDFICVGYHWTGSGGYMIKRDSNGNELWTIPYDDFGVQSAQKTNDGNIILAGRADYNAALRKITNSGETLWTSVINLDSSIAYSVTQSNDGGYLITGTNYGDNDVLIIKADANGDSLWTRTFEGFGYNDRGNTIINSNNGLILAGGYIRISNTPHGFLVAYDDNGEMVWSKIFEFSFLNSISSMIQSNDGNYILQGRRLIKIDEMQNVLWDNHHDGFDIGAGDRNIQELSDNNLLYAGTNNSSILLIKTNSYGVVNIENGTLENIQSFYIANFPNPFNPSTTIRFTSEPFAPNELITLEIYNIKGQIVKTLANEQLERGNHSVVWHGKDKYGKSVSSGVYFYKLKVNGKNEAVKKCLLLK